jgi:hypothetical protein
MSFSELSLGHARDIACYVALLDATPGRHPLPRLRSTTEGADD